MICLGMHSNVMLRFTVQSFQDPPLCSSTYFSGRISCPEEKPAFKTERENPRIFGSLIEWYCRWAKLLLKVEFRTFMDTKIVQGFAQKLTTNISLIVNKPNYIRLWIWKYIHHEYLSSVMTKKIQQNIERRKNCPYLANRSYILLQKVRLSNTIYII